MTTPVSADQERLFRELLHLSGFDLSDEWIRRMLPDLANMERTSARLREVALTHVAEPAFRFDPRTGARGA